MTIFDRLFPDFTEILPEVNRCRDYHIYDGRGRRYLDMYLSGGTALLGHRPNGISLRVKNVMAKGLWANYPTAWPGRLKKELNSLLPAYPEVLLFSGLIEAERWLNDRFPGKEVLDPAVSDSDTDHPALWRPFCPSEYSNTKEGGEGLALVPILPFPGPFTPGMVCLPEGSIRPEEKKLYSGASIPPYILAGVVRAAALVRSHYEDLSSDRTGAKPDGHKPGSTGKKGSAGDKAPCDRKLTLPQWEKRGPYLKYTGSTDAYRTCFKAALARQILLPPAPELPLVIPGLYSRGEIGPLIEIFSSID
ncbi:MAG: hypothetical protein JEY99_05845 [Spirochaetales bacterium]|nr:hypothetical protein [Spirochaetales bacterium]